MSRVSVWGNEFASRANVGRFDSSRRMDSAFLLHLALYALTGIVTGVLAGLLGVGGGLIVVPALSYLFELQGFPAEATLHLAIGTSLGTIVFTSLSSTTAHHRQGAVDWGIVARITPGILVGTALGGILAAHMETSVLKAVFAAFLIVVAIQMLSGAKPRPTRQLPGSLGSSAVGLVIGAVSGLVGIGGGSMSVPFMVWCNVGMRRAVGTSAAIGFPIAFSGALSYMINGLRASTGVAHAFGYLHLPSLAGVAFLSVLTAPLGARLTSILDPGRVKRGFAGLLLVMSAKMLWSVFVR
jgi:uncharacterized protein